MKSESHKTFKDVIIYTPTIHGDSRGYFFESYKTIPKYNPVQENESLSEKVGTLRGFHLQTGEFAQAKLVRVVKGAVIDYFVDLREGSLTYGKWGFIELNQENKKAVFIPRGFAHAFLVIEGNTIVQYKVDNIYSKENDISVIWNKIDIELTKHISNQVNNTMLTLSEKDENGLSMKDYERIIYENRK